jgi:hypothetical protein
MLKRRCLIAQIGRRVSKANFYAASKVRAIQRTMFIVRVCVEGES